MHPGTETTRRLLGTLLLACVLPANAALPGDYEAVQRNGRVLAQVAEDLPTGKLSATLVCLDGHEFALGAMLGPGGVTSSAVSIVQVYATEGGQVRPATCSNR